MLRYRAKLTTAVESTRPFQIKKSTNESARLNSSINDEPDILRAPSANTLVKQGQAVRNWSQWQQMSKNDVNLNGIKIAENRYSAISASLRKPIHQVNA
jgi:hypothetical protein